MIMEVRYNPTFVVLSVLVAILASYLALDFASTVAQAKGRVRAFWLLSGALAMGVGIWSMHFIGMLAFDMPGMDMSYDIPLFLLSIVIAVAASALALFVVSRPSLSNYSFVAGGFAMAAAIAGMHYTGMYSMRMEAVIRWNLVLVAASVLIALAASFVALIVAIRLRYLSGLIWQRGIASVVMGAAIAGMHYTGMAAATFIHSPVPRAAGPHLIASDSLGFAVVVGTLILLCLALAGAVVNRAFVFRTKRAEESERLFREANRALGELEKERELRSRFVSALAHDLRTPLAAAQMSCQLGIRNSLSPEAVERFYGRAVESLQRMDKMIQDLLDANRISAGQPLPLHIEKCVIADLLQKTVEDLTTVYGNRFLLDADRSLESHWDCQYVRRAVENLCTNAVKYGTRGSVVKVSAQLSSGERNMVTLSVHNEGEPLAPEDREQLFELFNRGRHAQNGGVHGWGLGLTLVKGVSEAHGGSISVESSPGRGTTFAIRIPLDTRPA